MSSASLIFMLIAWGVIAAAVVVGLRSLLKYHASDSAK